MVHGSAQFSHAVIVNSEVSLLIHKLSPLAPLHNPYNLKGIELMQKLLPQIPQVAVFDTSYHAGMPDYAYAYALPYAFCEEEKIRRYGFHGSSHKLVSLSAATFLNRRIGELKIISCHLGNGASVCAIQNGRSVDTSMGMTSLEGLTFLLQLFDRPSL